jgi:hypothetical protein
MPLDDLRFTPALMTRPPPCGLAAETSLRHFTIVTFTQPTRGFFGATAPWAAIRIWHDRMAPTEGRVKVAEFPLLNRLGLVAEGDLKALHSVLIQPRIDFTIYLPPVRIRPKTTAA